MQVTKITEEGQLPSHNGRAFTTEELQQEYNYHIAQKWLMLMLQKGLISVAEFNKITEKNRQSFSPFLAEIMSKMT
jgi:hypothetical protein